MSQTPDIVESLRFQLRDWNGKNRFAFSKVNALTISEAARLGWQDFHNQEQRP